MNKAKIIIGGLGVMFASGSVLAGLEAGQGTPTPLPVPGVLALLAIGVAALYLFRRK